MRTGAGFDYDVIFDAGQKFAQASHGFTFHFRFMRSPVGHLIHANRRWALDDKSLAAGRGNGRIEMRGDENFENIPHDI